MWRRINDVVDVLKPLVTIVTFGLDLHQAVLKSLRRLVGWLGTFGDEFHFGSYRLSVVKIRHPKTGSILGIGRVPIGLGLPAWAKMLNWNPVA